MEGVRVVSAMVVRETRRYDEMVGFYRDVLGWSPIRSWDRAEDDRGMVLASDPARTVVVEVLRLGDLGREPGAGPANTRLSVEVDDVEAAHRWLADAGWSIARDIEDTGWGHRSFGIDDPDGLRIWLYEVIDEHPG